MGKGFKRTRKQWEEALADNIGKFIHKVKIDELIPFLFSTYMGYRASQRIGGDTKSNLIAAGSGGVAYKLATSMNTPAGMMGTGYLTLIGMLNLPFSEIDKTLKEKLVEAEKGVQEGLIGAEQNLRKVLEERTDFQHVVDFAHEFQARVKQYAPPLGYPPEHVPYEPEE